MIQPAEGGRSSAISACEFASWYSCHLSENRLHHTTSMTDILCVQCAGFIRFVGAFDNGAAVFKYGKLIRRAVLYKLKLEKELVISHRSGLFQHAREIG